MNFLAKVAVVTAVAAAGVVAVRRLDLVNKGAALAEAGVDKAATGAEQLVAKAAEVMDNLLTKFDQANDPTEDPADSGVEPKVEYTRGSAGSSTIGRGDVL